MLLTESIETGALMGKHETEPEHIEGQLSIDDTAEQERTVVDLHEINSLVSTDPNLAANSETPVNHLDHVGEPLTDEQVRALHEGGE